MTLPDILRALDADSSTEAADRFCRLATDYLELSSDPHRPRPVPAAGAELAQRSMSLCRGLVARCRK